MAHISCLMLTKQSLGSIDSGWLLRVVNNRLFKESVQRWGLSGSVIGVLQARVAVVNASTTVLPSTTHNH